MGHLPLPLHYCASIQVKIMTGRGPVSSSWLLSFMLPNKPCRHWSLGHPVYSNIKKWTCLGKSGYCKYDLWSQQMLVNDNKQKGQRRGRESYLFIESLPPGIDIVQVLLQTLGAGAVSSTLNKALAQPVYILLFNLQGFNLFFLEYLQLEE